MEVATFKLLSFLEFSFNGFVIMLELFRKVEITSTRNILIIWGFVFTSDAKCAIFSKLLHLIQKYLCRVNTTYFVTLIWPWCWPFITKITTEMDSTYQKIWESTLYITKSEKKCNFWDHSFRGRILGHNLDLWGQTAAATRQTQGLFHHECPPTWSHGRKIAPFSANQNVLGCRSISFFAAMS